MAGIDTTKVRDRWGTKLYESFQRNEANVSKTDDTVGALGYTFPGTKFDGGIAAEETPPQQSSEPSGEDTQP